LQRDEQQQGSDSDDGGQADIEHVVHEKGDDDGLQGPDPQIVQKYDADVESVDVIGQEIYRLADGSLAQRGPGQSQRFAIDERAAGHADLHAHVQDRHHVRMNDEDVDGGTEDDTRGVHVRLELVDLPSVVVAQQLTQEDGLQHPAPRDVKRDVNADRSDRGNPRSSNLT